MPLYRDKATGRQRQRAAADPIDAMLSGGGRPSGGGGGGGVNTTIAGGVGITNTAEPITTGVDAAGTVDLDINSLTTEMAIATGDLFPMVDVSVGTTPSAQRKITRNDLLGVELAGLSTLAGTGVISRTGAGTYAFSTGATSRITYWASTTGLTSTAGFEFDGINVVTLPTGGKIGIGVAPSFAFHAAGTTTQRLKLDTTSNSDGTISRAQLYRSRVSGGVTSATAVNDTNVLGGFDFIGDPGDGNLNASAVLFAVAAENFDTTGGFPAGAGRRKGAHFDFYTTVLGDSTAQRRMRLTSEGRLRLYEFAAAGSAPMNYTEFYCDAAQSTDIVYQLPTAQAGAAGQVLTNNGAGILTWTAPGSGYTQIQEEGVNLTVRTTLDFIGAAITAADAVGPTRTTVTLSQSPAGSASVVGIGRLVSTATGLSGGGDLSADRTIALDFPSLTTETAVAAGDFFPFVDISAGNAHRKVTFEELENDLNINNLTGGPLLASGGGTGFSAYTVGDILYADTISTLARLADVSSGSYLRSGGVSVAPLWSTLKLPNVATINCIAFANATNSIICNDTDLQFDTTTNLLLIDQTAAGTGQIRLGSGVFTADDIEVRRAKAGTVGFTFQNTGAGGAFSTISGTAFGVLELSTFGVNTWDIGSRAAGEFTLREGGGGTQRLRVSVGGNVTVGTATTGSSLLNVGTADQLRVASDGDLVRIKDVPYVWPAANAAGVLLNNGTGTLSWTTLATGIDHGGLTGLLDDDHTQYLLLAGRGTNQTAHGGTGTGNTLTLRSNTLQDGIIRLGDDITKDEQVVIHGTTAGITIGGSAFLGELTIHEEGTAGHANLIVHKHSATGTQAATIGAGRTRGTESLPTVVADNDGILRLLAVGYDGVDYERSSQILFEIDDPAPSSTSMGGAIVLSTTPTSSTTLSERLRIAQDGRVSVTGSGFSVNGLNYTWPASQATARFLRNDSGPGTLTWAALTTTDYPLTVAEDGTTIATDSIRLDFRDTDNTVVTDVGTDARISLQGYALLAGRIGGQTLTGCPGTLGAATDTLTFISRDPTTHRRPGSTFESGLWNIDASTNDAFCHPAALYIRPSITFNSDGTSGLVSFAGLRVGGAVSGSSPVVTTRDTWRVRAANLVGTTPGAIFLFDLIPDIRNSASQNPANWGALFTFAHRPAFRTDTTAPASTSQALNLSAAVIDQAFYETTNTVPLVAATRIIESQPTGTATSGLLTMARRGVSESMRLDATAGGNVSVEYVDYNSAPTFTTAGGGTFTCTGRYGTRLLPPLNGSTIGQVNNLVGHSVRDHAMVLSAGRASISYQSGDDTAYVQHAGSFTGHNHKGETQITGIANMASCTVVATVGSGPAVTTWAYTVVAFDVFNNPTVAPASTTIVNGAATLMTFFGFPLNYNTITWPQVDGAAYYEVYRTTSGGTPSSTGRIATIGYDLTECRFQDDGFAGNGASAPTTNTTAKAFFDCGQRVRVSSGLSYPYTALVTDYIIQVDTTGAARTINLPAAATAASGRVYIVKDEDGNAAVNNITIDASGAELIDGALTKVINTNYGVVRLYCTGTAWLTF